MSQGIDEARRKLLRSAFRMPSPPTMVSRKSTITNAFVCAIIPVIEPTAEDIEQALEILAIDPVDLRCAYCGDRATEWDHLRPLVKNRRPTGFISEIGNLVPSCGKCNQSKGNSDWERWMRSSAAKWSPTSRRVSGTEGRIERLREYERWRPEPPVDFPGIVGDDAWEAYWKRLDHVDAMLAECQNAAAEIGQKIAVARHGLRRTDMFSPPECSTSTPDRAVPRAEP